MRVKGILQILLLVGMGLTLSWVPSWADAPESPAGPSGIGVPPDSVSSQPKRPLYPKSRLTYDDSEEEADKRSLLLESGEDKAVDVDFEVNGGTGGITVGNPGIVLVTLVKTPDSRQLVFKPQKAGETTVTVRDNDGTIRLIFFVKVTPNNLLRISHELQSLLRDIEGLEFRVVGGKVVIEGEVLVPLDYGRLLSVVLDKAYADIVLNLVILSPLALQAMAKRIQDDIANFAPNVKTRVVNGMIFLEGTVDNADQAGRAVKIASYYLPDYTPGNLLEKDPTVQRAGPRSRIVNFIVINPPPRGKQEKLVRVTFHFVELSKDYDRVFGFKWMPGFTADPQIAIGQAANGSTGASTGASFSATISSLLPKLQSAQTAGFARILRTGTVVVKSGQPASLNETTQIPYLVAGQNGQMSSQNAEIGLTAAVTPQVLGQTDEISLEVKLDQTDLVSAGLNGGAPTTSKHKVETKLFVKSNESAAVAGVNSTDIGTNFNKNDPQSGNFSSGTDPLFTLLHSKEFTKKKSQFVIFVTPQIIENASDGTDDLKKNFRIRVK